MGRLFFMNVCIGTLVAVSIKGALSFYDDLNIGIDRKMPMPFILAIFPMWRSILPHPIQYTYTQ
jgi:hypothetical protein